MKLTIERAALLKALSHVQSVVERRTTIPILSNVLLSAETGQLALSATDMDLEIVERVAARIERDGRTTAPAHTLYDIVRKLREGAQIELETSGGRNEMVLRSGRSTFTLACLPPEDYPVMSAGELPHHFALSAAEMRTLIDRTRFAISTEETRYYLNGIYLHATKSNEVPVVRLLTWFQRSPEPHLGAHFGARGEFSVEILVLFPHKSARAVTDAVTQPYAQRMKELPSLVSLTVGEVANILAQSVVSQMADEFRLPIILTVPRVLEGSKAGVFGESLEHYDGRVDTLMLSHVDMYSENLAAQASMIVIANSEGLHARLKALDLA